MTLSSRHKSQNSSSSGLRPNTLPLGHRGSPQYWIFTSEGEEAVLFLWNLNARVGFEPAISDFPSRQLWNHCTRAPAPVVHCDVNYYLLTVTWVTYTCITWTKRDGSHAWGWYTPPPPSPTSINTPPPVLTLCEGTNKNGIKDIMSEEA